MHSANKVFVAAFVLATVLLASGQLRELALAAADYAAECIGLQEPAEAQTFNAIGGRLLRGISTTDPRCTTPCCRSPACGPGQTFSCPSPRRPETRRQCLGCATDNAPACPGGLDPQCTGPPANSRWVCPTNPTEACPETRPSCSSGVNPTCSGSPNWEWVCPRQTIDTQLDFGCLGATLDRVLCGVRSAILRISAGNFASCGSVASSEESHALDDLDFIPGRISCGYTPQNNATRSEYIPSTTYNFVFSSNPTPGTLRIRTPDPYVLQSVYEQFGGSAEIPGGVGGVATTAGAASAFGFSTGAAIQQSLIAQVQATLAGPVRHAATVAFRVNHVGNLVSQAGAIQRILGPLSTFLGPVTIATHFLQFISREERCTFTLAGGPITWTRCVGSVERCAVVAGGSALQATMTDNPGANVVRVYYHNGSGSEQSTQLRCRRAPRG